MLKLISYRCIYTFYVPGNVGLVDVHACVMLYMTVINVLLLHLPSVWVWGSDFFHG